MQKKKLSEKLGSRKIRLITRRKIKELFFLPKIKEMIQRKTKTPISKSTYAQKSVEGNISTRKVIEDLKKTQMVFLEVKNTMCEMTNRMC